MRLSKAEKRGRAVNDAMPAEIEKVFFDKFGIKVAVKYSIFNMGFVASREDGRKFTPQQYGYLSGAFDAYAAASSVSLNYDDAKKKAKGTK